MEYEPNPGYQEILRLDKMLTEANIPHQLKRRLDGWQIIYPRVQERWTLKGVYNDWVCDAVEFEGTYGYEDDKLEIMGLLTDEEEQHDRVLGNLTAEEVFERIKTHYENNKGVN